MYDAIHKGLKQGREEGLKEGLEQARDEKIEIINKLSSKGMKDSDISDVVGLSESEVRKIINNDK